MTLSLKVGGIYLDQDGKKNIINRQEGNRFYGGYVTDPIEDIVDGGVWWTVSGFYSGTQNHPFSLVSVVSEPRKILSRSEALKLKKTRNSKRMFELVKIQ